MDSLDNDETGFQTKLDTEFVKVSCRSGSKFDKNLPTIKVVVTITETDDPKEVFEAVSTHSLTNYSTWSSTKGSSGTQVSPLTTNCRSPISTCRQFTW